jgi:hypothetical protein
MNVYMCEINMNSNGISAGFEECFDGNLEGNLLARAEYRPWLKEILVRRGAHRRHFFLQANHHEEALELAVRAASTLLEYEDKEEFMMVHQSERWFWLSGAVVIKTTLAVEAPFLLATNLGEIVIQKLREQKVAQEEAKERAEYERLKVKFG